MTDQRVYFVQGSDGGPIKIGIAADVMRRLGSLQTGSPIKLALLAHKPGGEEEEWRLHQLLKAHRLHGEWFADANEVREQVKLALSFDQEFVREPKPEKSAEQIDLEARKRAFLQKTFAAALRESFGDGPHLVKEISACSGSSAHSVTNWLNCKGLPQLTASINLARGSDGMLMWMMCSGSSFMLANYGNISEWEAWKLQADRPDFPIAVWHAKTNEELFPIMDEILAAREAA